MNKRLGEVGARLRRTGVGTLVAGVVVLALGGGGWAWWSSRTAPSAQPAEPTSEAVALADGSVQISDVQLRAQGVQMAQATAATSVTVQGLPAQAMAPLAASAQVVVPFAGVVTRLLLDEGEPVRQGQAMVRIQSRDVITAQAEQARAQAEATAAALQARRDAALLAEGIIAAARNEQAQARLAAARSAQRQAAGMLAQLRPVGGGQAGEYEVLAPLTGRVLRRQLVPGQAVAALDTAYVVAASGNIDIQVSAPLRLRAALHPGVQVRLPDGITAEVVSVGADVDPASQSLRVRAQLEGDLAAASGYTAGQQFSVDLLLPAPAQALSVPSSALLPSGADHVLYVVQRQPSAMWRVQAVPVRLLGQDATTSTVQAIVPDAAQGNAQPSLAAGMQVVTRGTALLKSMLPLQ